MFKPGDKVRRIGETFFRYKNKSPLDVIKGHVYTVRSYYRGSNRIKLIGYGDFEYDAACFELVKEEEMSECICNKKTPHVHAELIKAWADGATIQYLYSDGDWKDVGPNGPAWTPTTRYRIKPEPKPDVVTYACLEGRYAHRAPVIISSSSNNWNEDGKPSYTNRTNIKLIYDGETGKLKSAEVIE